MNSVLGAGAILLSLTCGAALVFIPEQKAQGGKLHPLSVKALAANQSHQPPRQPPPPQQPGPVWAATDIGSPSHSQANLQWWLNGGNPTRLVDGRPWP